MNVKRGYPNPNYTEEDILSGKVTEEDFEELMDPGLVMVETDHYEELVAKAAALDILTASIRRKGEVNADIVWAVTGAQADPEIEKAKKESSERFDWYWREKQRADQLHEENEKLKRKLAEAECSLNEQHQYDPNWPPKKEEDD